MKLTKQQQRALRNVFTRQPLGISYLAFRRQVHPGSGCIMVKWCGMWLGIETNGYTHS